MIVSDLDLTVGVKMFLKTLSGELIRRGTGFFLPGSGFSPSQSTLYFSRLGGGPAKTLRCSSQYVSKEDKCKVTVTLPLEDSLLFVDLLLDLLTIHLGLLFLSKPDTI